MSRRYEKRISRKKASPERPDRKEKGNNRKISKVRVKVEHVIAGIKRSRSVKDALRKTDFQIW
jgi:hypothetical protein